ncbi:hypothetical protein [Salinicoccus sp. Marseille-QA3877]
MNKNKTIELINGTFEDVIHDYEKYPEEMEVDNETAQEVISALDTMQQVITTLLLDDMGVLK